MATVTTNPVAKRRGMKAQGDLLGAAAQVISLASRSDHPPVRTSAGVVFSAWSMPYFDSQRLCTMADPTAATGSNDAATTALLLANRREFLGFLERHLGPQDAAEDVLQAAYLKAIRTSASIQHEESTVAWFYRLLRNTLVDLRRRRAIEVRALERHGHEHALDVDGEDEPLRAAVCRCIDGLMLTLRPDYVEIVRRVDLDGASVQEAARALGVTTNNAHVRLHRARAALRKQLERTCGACTEHACLECTCPRSVELHPDRV
jgi:RNA polymerase sigma-70 factor (ECF subfamily)